METLGERLQWCLKERKLKPIELANAMAVPRSTVSSWLHGHTHALSAENLLRVAEYLTVSVDWLNTGKGSPYRQANTAPTDAKVTAIPIISWVAAGYGRDCIDLLNPGDSAGMIETTDRVSRLAFALTITGDSMVSPTGGTSIYPGMVIVVDPSLEPNVGDIVVARINGDEEATCKRLVKHGGKLWLAALNPTYPMIEVDESTKLIGPVKSASYRFR